MSSARLVAENSGYCERAKIVDFRLMLLPVKKPKEQLRYYVDVDQRLACEQEDQRKPRNDVLKGREQAM